MCVNRLAALFITIQDGGRKDRPSYGEVQSEPAGDGREANLSYRRLDHNRLISYTQNIP